MAKFNYKEELRISKYKLDEELIRQPQKFLDWALAWVDAADKKDRAKTFADLERAEVESIIRKDPERFDLGEKPTEAAVKAAIAKHRRVIKSIEALQTATTIERTLSEVKYSFRQRKSMLEKLVDLNMMMRFSDVKVPAEKNEQLYQHKTRSIKRRLRESMD
jgi:hypothetical protein